MNALLRTEVDLNYESEIDRNESEHRHSVNACSNDFCFSLTGRADAQNVKLYFLYRQYSNLFIFRFVYLQCLGSTLHFMFLSDEGPTLKTLDFYIRIGSTPTFLYFDLYLYTAYAAHYTFIKRVWDRSYNELASGWPRYKWPPDIQSLRRFFRKNKLHLGGGVNWEKGALIVHKNASVGGRRLEEEGCT